MKKLEKFIVKAINVHADKYDYSLVVYENSQKKVKIICPEHGIFEQRPANHNRGQGCPSCAGVKRNTQSDFIYKASEVHNNKYDYSLVEYKNNKTKIKIICHEHGVFEQRPDNHLNKKTGCPICADNQLYSSCEYIEKAKKVHDNKYDYSLVIYKNAKSMIKIICPEHGEFKQKAYSHLDGIGCSKCSENYNYSTEEYIEKVKKVHGNKYDYSLAEYKNNKTKIKIICSIHGIFEQNPKSHLNGHGCQKCFFDENTDNKQDFVNKSKNKHGNKYDYSLVEYINSYTNVKIICPNHGIFEQRPSTHTNGGGCSLCKESKGEREVSLYLDDKNIKYERQKIFEDCKDVRHLPFDFYLPKYNMCIEYDGLQHFKPIEFFGGEKTFLLTKEHDRIKNEYCEDNGIKLIRIKYNQKIKKQLNLVKN